MNLEDVRPSFSIYVITPHLDDHGGLIEALTLAGYLTSGFADLDAAFVEVAINPPHVIVIEDADGAAGVTRARDRVRAHLPETHVIALAALADRDQFVPLLEDGIYDLVWLPLVAPIEVQRAVDRAVERDWFMYQNERLTAAPAPPAVSAASVMPPPIEIPATAFARELFGAKTVDECVDVFLNEVGGAGVFFRYLANRRTLIIANALGLDPAVTAGVGLNLNDEVAGFRNGMLREPRQLPAFTRMVEEVLRTTTWVTRHLENAGEVTGVFVWPDRTEDDAALDDRLMLLDRAIGLLEAQRRLHVVNTRDDATEVLAKPHFMECVVNEISRARRVNLPVAVLVMAFDQYDLVGGDVGTNEAQLMLKTIAKLCERYSRVNDVIGRIGAGELGSAFAPHRQTRGFDQGRTSAPRVGAGRLQQSLAHPPAGDGINRGQ